MVADERIDSSAEVATQPVEREEAHQGFIRVSPAPMVYFNQSIDRDAEAKL